MIHRAKRRSELPICFSERASELPLRGESCKWYYYLVGCVTQNSAERDSDAFRAGNYGPAKSRCYLNTPNGRRHHMQHETVKGEDTMVDRGFECLSQLRQRSADS